MTTAPIADLSYRGYDGELNDPRSLWWVIAKTMAKQAFARRLYWVVTAFSGWYFMVLLVILFFTERIAANSFAGGRRADVFQQLINRIIWKDQLLHGFNFAQLLYLILALMLGAGAIANDNRANALLVYLAKPCTKRDYIFGKFLGVAMPIFVAMALPSAVFYLYGALSYHNFGFLSDPWAYPKALIGMVLAAGFHAAIALSVSSLFRQGRMAGAVYAGMYLLAEIFVTFVVGLWTAFNMHEDNIDRAQLAVLEILSRLSINGFITGSFKAIIGSTGSPPFGQLDRSAELPPPMLWPCIAVYIGVYAVCFGVMWVRVKAVEVIK